MSIFSRLRRFRPTAIENPLEDFTTEAFVGVLEANPSLGWALATHLAKLSRWTEPLPTSIHPTWTTQARVDTGIIDLVVEMEGGPIFVCEHKVWARLADGQIARYRSAMEPRYGSRVKTVLLTAHRGQWTESADVRLTWADVHELVATWNATHGPGSLVEDLLVYLRAEGLGPPAPVSHESLVSWIPSRRLEGALDTLWKRVLHEVDWTAFAELFSALRSPVLPPTFDYRWGRMGLNLAAEWRPGLFIGTMMNGADHRVQFVDSAKGPDFSLILSYHLDDGWPTRDEYLSSKEYAALRVRLQQNADGYDLVDMLDRHPREQNPWHPLHLRRPMLEVLLGTTTADEQVERIRSEIARVVRVLLAGGELCALAVRTGRPTP